MNPILETERLYLREMTQEDYTDLSEILQDAETMYAYEHAFSDEETQAWLDNQLRRYREDGFGLWAVVRKEDGAFVGQCGLTWQETDQGKAVEVGYLFKRRYWHNGYAAEAARGCLDYGFDKLGLQRMVTIIRDSNTASQNVAKRNGLEADGKFVKHYYGMDMPHIVYAITSGQWRQKRKEFE